MLGKVVRLFGKSVLTNLCKNSIYCFSVEADYWKADYYATELNLLNINRKCVIAVTSTFQMILRLSGKVLNWISNAIREVIFHLLYSSLRWWRTSLGTWNPTSWWTCACWSVRWPSDSHCLHLFGTSCDPSLNLVLFSSCVSYRILYTQTNTLSRNIQKKIIHQCHPERSTCNRNLKNVFFIPPPPKKTR